MTLKRGNIVAIKRLLVDLIGVVSKVEGDKVEVRCLHEHETGQVLSCKPEDILLLTEEQEKEFPLDLIGAVEKQRTEIFKPTRKSPQATSVTAMLKGASRETLDAIWEIITEEDKQEND